MINGAGGAASTSFEYLIHRYDFDRGVWTSHHPALVDSTFTSLDEIWRRRLDVTSDGMLVAVSYAYDIEVFDPQRGFALESTVRRHPQGWPLDAAAENARLVLRFIVGPGMFAHYAGDLPYPQFEILEIDLNKEDP